MDTYKIGNSITAVIRAYTSTTIGSTIIKYDNQPYAIVTTESATINFKDNNTATSARFNVFQHTAQQVSEIKLSDIRLTDRIMSLIFPPIETQLMTKIEHHTVSRGNYNIYLSTTEPTVYQLFVYNDKQQLKGAYGSFDTTQSIYCWEDGAYEHNIDYLFCYQYPSKSTRQLASREDCYFTVDLITTTTSNNTTSQTTIHLEKCGLEVDKRLAFSGRSNTVDLKFIVLDTQKDYIATA